MDSLTILYESNEKFNWGKFNWGDYRDKLGPAVSKYNELITKDADPARGLRGLLPVYWQSVRAINTYQWVEVGRDDLPSSVGYDVGIFLVGFSSLPIVLSIAEIQPNEIYFIHSSDTGTKCEEITKRFKEMLEIPDAPFKELIDPSGAKSLIEQVESANKQEIADASDPVSTFRKIKDIIDNVRRESGADTKIALDLTGGKKTMIGGGFTAGSIYSVSPKCDMFYVDSLEYDPELGAPTPGSEFLSKLDNPYDVYNVQTVAQARELFKNHNYQAAVDLWHEVNKKLNHTRGGGRSLAIQYGLTSEQDAVEKNLYMTDCYSLWDAFDYIGAKGTKDNCVKHGCNWGYDKHAHKTINVLNILEKVDDLERHLTAGTVDDQLVIHYAVDRYQNGIRRMESHKYDDAIVRFTQVIEILSKYKLYQIAENGGLLRLDKNALRLVWETWNTIDRWHTWNLTPLLCFLFRDEDSDIYESHPYSYKISNHDHCLDLGAYSYGRVSQITDLIGPRNNFIHVRDSPEWKTMVANAEGLANLACEFLHDFSGSYRTDNDLSFDKLLKLHEFCRL